MLYLTNKGERMFEKFIQNARRPEGFVGGLFLAAMNLGHRAISRWGLGHLAIGPGDLILDIGCGGGRNVARMLKRAPEGRVCGLDHAELSVEKARQLNRKAVREGRSDIRLGSVSKNPWPDNSFDIVTAFETVYFWPDFANDLREIRRVLKPGGLFFICNEMNKTEEGRPAYRYWIETLDMKTYTAADFRKHLAGAGFTGVEIITQGKNGICVSARKPAPGGL
jgi:ubiquinone/menaquinone biosynthesis C-methylase UbiE